MKFLSRIKGVLNDLPNADLNAASLYFGLVSLQGTLTDNSMSP